MKGTFPPSSHLHWLMGRRFCEFHNSPLYNPVQTELWQRIYTAIHSVLPLHNRVDLSFPGRYALRSDLEEMSQVLKTNHIPLVEAEDFGMEVAGPLPVDTHCPGQSFPSFPLAVANLQVVISAGSAQDFYGTIYVHLWSRQCCVKTIAYLTG